MDCNSAPPTIQCGGINNPCGTPGWQTIIQRKGNLVKTGLCNNVIQLHSETGWQAIICLFYTRVGYQGETKIILQMPALWFVLSCICAVQVYLLEVQRRTNVFSEIALVSKQSQATHWIDTNGYCWIECSFGSLPCTYPVAIIAHMCCQLSGPLCCYYMSRRFEKPDQSHAVGIVSGASEVPLATTKINSIHYT